MPMPMRELESSLPLILLVNVRGRYCGLNHCATLILKERSTRRKLEVARKPFLLTSDDESCHEGTETQDPKQR